MSDVKYTLSEGTLTLPEAVQDRSMTILTLPKARSSLVLTRAWDVKPGDEEAYLKSQVAKIKRDMKKFTGGEVQDTQVGGRPAHEVAMRFENNGVTVHEQLATTMLDDHLLVMAMSRTVPFDEDALATWGAIKAGLEFTPGEGA
ncbi:DcrB-related protein [Cronobacter dublinensis]